MDFLEVLKEISELSHEYNKNCKNLSRDQCQDYRDKLSHLAANLATYRANFYEDHISAEMIRKISFAKECDRLMESNEVKAKNRAELKAMIHCEEYYKNEVKCDGLLNRARFIGDSLDQILNSIASRMQALNKINS